MKTARRASRDDLDDAIRRARIVLIGLFVGFRALDVAILLGAPAHHRPQVAAALALTGIWSTFFLTAIWMRKSWARYIFSAFLVLALAIFSVGIFELIPIATSFPRLLLMTLGVYFTALLLLVYLPSMRELTRL